MKPLAMSVIGAIICFLVVTNIMQPGLLDLTTPTHSDFYRYFLLSEKRWLPMNWLEPRPLMLAYLKISGVLHQPKVLFLLLALPALLFVSLIPYVVTRAGLAKQSVLAWLVFFVMAFGSPYFYQIFQFDYGGMLSGVFAVLAVSFGLTALTRNAGPNSYIFCALAFCLLSIESKPTYSFALIYLALVALILLKDRKSILIFGGVLAILVCVFIKDKILGSPFVASADAQSPYAVVINPAKNISVLIFYLYHAFTGPLIFATLLSVAVLAICREWKLVIITIGLCIFSSAPMSLLVNRQWESYSWYSTIPIGLLIMFAVNRLQQVLCQTNQTKTRVGAILVLVSLVGSVFAHALTRHPSVEWTLANQAYNRNVLKALESIEANADGRKVLIAGIRGPYHPFKNTAYVNREFPYLGQFDVLLRKDEEVWNRFSHELTNGVYLDQLDLDNYSLVVVFGPEGRIIEKVRDPKLSDLNALDRDVLLVCGAEKKRDPTTLSQIINCLNDAGEYTLAIEIGKKYLALGEKQPWIYYHLSRAYLNSGNTKSAHAEALKALASEPSNGPFQKAVKESTLNIKGQ